MSQNNQQAEPIEGYTVAIFKKDGNNPIFEEDLRLSRIGGAHITNPEALIMMIEDAVFHEEDKR